MKVKEIMQREVLSVKPQDSVVDALDLLLKRQISGLPVIDAEGKLVGVFTEKEVLSHILPSYIDKVGKFVYEENPKSLKKKFMSLGNKKVNQLMRHDVVTTNEETTLCEAARLMLTCQARRLPVLNKSGLVVGIVARCDILKALVKEGEASVNI